MKAKILRTYKKESTKEYMQHNFSKIRVNTLCLCGSGRKYKKCCQSEKENSFYLYKGKNRSYKRTFQSNSYVRIPAALLEMKQSGILSGNEISVCAFLLSVQSASKAVNNFNGIQVSRTRIALSCGITARTVGNILKKLESMELIHIYRDEWNGKRKSNVYVIGEPLLDLSGGFFYVPRKIFKKGLEPKQLIVYFLLCHAQDYEYSRSWNSYNDMARRLRMNRGEVIKLITQLESAGYIAKKRRKIKERGKGDCYADNRYSVTWLIFFAERSGGHAPDRHSFPIFIFLRKMRTKIKKDFSNLHYTLKSRCCQDFSLKNLEYELSNTLLNMEEIIGEQLRIPVMPESWQCKEKVDYEAFFEGFPF